MAVPDFHGAVLPRRGDPPTIGVGAERRRPDVPAMSLEGLEFPAGLHVPDLDRVLLPPATRRRPSGLNAMLNAICAARAWMVRRASCFSPKRVASQSFTVPSPLAEARCRPSRLKTSPRIARSWVPSVPTSRPVSRVPHLARSDSLPP